MITKRMGRSQRGGGGLVGGRSSLSEDGTALACFCRLGLDVVWIVYLMSNSSTSFCLLSCFLLYLCTLSLARSASLVLFDDRSHSKVLYCKESWALRCILGPHSVIVVRLVRRLVSGVMRRAYVETHAYSLGEKINNKVWACFECCKISNSPLLVLVDKTKGYCAHVCADE
jgi:hypothetical protein